MTKSYILTLLLSFLFFSTIAQVNINEFVFIPESGNADGGTAAGEWVELYGVPGTNLGCYVLTDGDWTVTIPKGTLLGADGLYVIGKATYANSPGLDGTTDVDLDLETCGCTNSEPNMMDLSNTGEFIALFDGQTGPPTFVDGIIYGTPTGGDTPSGNTTITASSASGCSAVTVDIGSNAGSFLTVSLDSGGAGREIDGTGAWGEVAPQDITPNGSNSGALPVELTYFEVDFSEDMVKLLWETSSEKDNEYFGIEHSEDGILFKEIGRELGAGTTSSIQDYYFIHENVSKGIHYYRLKQVDFDGKYEYSDIRSITISQSSRDDLQIYPTIVKDILTIQSASSFEKNSMYSVFDILGRKLEAGILNEEDSIFELNTSNWYSGHYFIQITQGENRISKQVIK